ncbi:PGPGW domain-containing protein [Plantibacter sp. RU18]|uniref:PGPGW domain-containing protein n=1 Tax=Plantibacter sp. RU18 TaxID=3158143 RepID=UPI003D369816
MTTESDNTGRTTAKRVGRAMGRAAGSAARSTRETIRRNPTANRVYRTGVGVVGGGTVALGVVLIPLLGPGSLIAVGGLAVLATEFDGAKKVSTKANAAAKSE